MGIDLTVAELTLYKTKFFLFMPAPVTFYSLGPAVIGERLKGFCPAESLIYI